MRARFFLTLFLLLAITTLSACASAIPRRRTLPEWVQTVYIPMFDNTTSEPGLEEWGTIYANEEFLADGRLKVGRRADADMIVAVTITNYAQEVESFEDDEFPSISSVRAEGVIRLFEPSNVEDPLAVLDGITAEHFYVSDFRRTDYVPEIDAKKEAMRALAGRVVQETIMGYLPEPEAQAAGELPWQRLDQPYTIRTARGITINPDMPRPVN